ncbi:MAG: 3-hydroxyacyl-CoA dehydrogenase NAD-binding domain-containing protein [Planctomycetota bacterium]
MAATECTRLEWHAEGRIEGGVAAIVLDHPTRRVNLLSASVFDEIERHLDSLAQRRPAGLVILSAKPGVFLAGADLGELPQRLDRPREEVAAACGRGQRLFARLAEAPCVTVAAIDGVCLGGGLELALWCDRRVLTASPKTQLGLPEVKLGLVPGWGGTARTPRLIGLPAAIELITTGEGIAAARAQALGLADDVLDPPPVEAEGHDARNRLTATAQRLLDAAIRMIEAEQAGGDYLRDRQRLAGPAVMSEAELAFLGATAGAVVQQKTGGQYPAPMAALELMLESSQADLGEACRLEAERFATLFGSPVNRALLNVFALTEGAKKPSKAELQQAERPGPPVEVVSVVGAGAMGQGIAAASLRRGLRVQLADARPESLTAGVAAVVREAAYDKAAGGPTAERAIEAATRVSAVGDPGQLAAEIVVEAITEDPAAKRRLFAQVEPNLPPDAALCTNTSTLPIATLADGLARPERFCGLHFFNPVRKMPLVEVVRGPQTGDGTIARAAGYARRLGKTPIVVGDGPGFLVNRLLSPYMAEAAQMAAEGVPIAQIERAAKRFGMPMGPLALHDMVGLDVCMHAGGVIRDAFPDRIPESGLVARLVAAGRLGQKNGKGFFDYPPGKPGQAPKGVPSDAVEAIIQTGRGDTPAAEHDLADRLLLPMLLEATRAIADGVAARPRDVDLALVLGIGFPAFRGGLLYWSDTLGAGEVLRRLEPLAALGERFQPTDMIRHAAQRGAKLYDL